MIFSIHDPFIHKPILKEWLSTFTIVQRFLNKHLPIFHDVIVHISIKFSSHHVFFFHSKLHIFSIDMTVIKTRKKRREREKQGYDGNTCVSLDSTNMQSIQIFYNSIAKTYLPSRFH